MALQQSSESLVKKFAKYKHKPKNSYGKFVTVRNKCYSKTVQMNLNT